MTDPASSEWPAMTIEEVHRALTAPEAMFEMAEEKIGGVTIRTYKNAPLSLRDLFDLSAVYGDKTFIVYEGERLSFADHRLATLKLAHVLQSQYGLKKGDRVALAMRNYPEWSIAFWATAVIGGIIVPLNAWGTGAELEYGITDSGASIAIVDGERLERIRPHLGNLNLSGVIAARTATDQLAGAESIDTLIGPQSAYGDLPESEIERVELGPEDNVTIFYTSGTTGKPKGALGTHRNILTNFMSMIFVRHRAALRQGEEPPALDPEAEQKGSLISVPFFHATGCHSILVPTLATGGKLVLMHHWNPEKAIELIEAEKLNSFGGVPAMVWQVLESPEFANHDLSSVEAIGYGGAPSAPDLVRRIKSAFPGVQASNGFGLTETSSVTTMNLGQDYVDRPDSAGLAVTVCDLKIVDDKGNDVPPGEVGELWIKGPNVVSGYWNKPEATAETFTDGWLHSGDLVRIDEEGFVYILDRAKDMLIRGGENIYCVEVEDALFAHPAVMDAAVVGIPHKVLGEEVGALVQIAPGQMVSVEELKAHVAKLLANFKVPVEIEMQSDPIPRNANGKIVKAPLREQFLKYSKDNQ